MAFYAAVPLGFALARPENALWAALLLASFVCTASSFLGRAVLAIQRGEPDDGARGAKSFFHAAGLIEGSETIIAFVLFCLFPSAFAWLAGIFAALCFWTAAARVINAAGSRTWSIRIRCTARSPPRCSPTRSRIVRERRTSSGSVSSRAPLFPISCGRTSPRATSSARARCGPG